MQELRRKVTLMEKSYKQQVRSRQSKFLFNLYLTRVDIALINCTVLLNEVCMLLRFPPSASSAQGL